MTNQVYSDLNRRSRIHGDVGESPVVTQNKALNFCIRACKKGAVLTAGYAMTKKGNFCLTLALVAGHQVIQSPSLEAMAAGMGAVTAAHMLIDWSRMRNKSGSISYDEQSINNCASDPDASSGGWGL